MSERVKASEPRGETPFQTIGPFFSFALDFRDGEKLTVDGTTGTPIVVSGTVLDGAGAPIPDALIEIWQANAAGRYHHPDDRRDAPALDPAFDGFGRAGTDDAGRFAFATIKPGRVPGPSGRLQAPHILVSVLGRGILTRLVTRLYFEDAAANADDPILAMVPEARRSTLVARLETPGRYRFNIVIQGDNETVFFDV